MCYLKSATYLIEIADCSICSWSWRVVCHAFPSYFGNGLLCQLYLEHWLWFRDASLWNLVSNPAWGFRQKESNSEGEKGLFKVADCLVLSVSLSQLFQNAVFLPSAFFCHFLFWVIGHWHAYKVTSLMCSQMKKKKSTNVFIIQNVYLH